MMVGLSLTSSWGIRAGEPVAATLSEFASGFVSPLFLTETPSGTLLVGDQTGVIYSVSKQGAVSEQPFLDLRPRMAKLNQGFEERGLLGLALHPKFKSNGRLFVCYSGPKRASAPADWDHTMRLSEFHVDSKSPSGLESSERVLLEVDKPYFNHNGGRLVFGQDGLLYIGVGDGGNAHDMGKRGPEGNGQDLTTHLGKILRIDVNSSVKPYGIPKDNPFIQGEGRPEIFAYGIRNPWGMCVDRGGKRALLFADVGQDRFEEINLLEKGGNYGWNLREGFDGFDPKNSKKRPESIPKLSKEGVAFVEPIIAYKNYNGFPKDSEAIGISVTGGYVYRGKALPALRGKYIFGDWSGNRLKPGGVLLAATPPASKTERQWSFERLEVGGAPGGVMKGYLVGFGEDASGELYLLTNDSNALTGRSGKVWRLLPAR